MCNNKTNIYLCSAQTASCTVVCAGCSSSKISDFSPRDYRNLKESQQQCYRDETNLPLSLFVVRFLLIFLGGGRNLITLKIQETRQAKVGLFI